MLSCSLRFFLFAAVTMRTFAFALPGILLSQLTQASPAWISPDYDISARKSDPNHDKLGAVASESSICSNIGIDILKKGGNAADSLVATVLCIGVVGMYHSGIGGGGFMLVRDKDGKFEDIDFRETAPAAAFQDMYNKNTVRCCSCSSKTCIDEASELKYLRWPCEWSARRASRTGLSSRALWTSSVEYGGHACSTCRSRRVACQPRSRTIHVFGN